MNQTPLFIPEGIEQTGNRTPYDVIGNAGRPDKGVEYTLPAKQGRAIKLVAGEKLKVTNVYGTQVGDLWAFAASNLNEHLSMTHVRADLRKLAPVEGDQLVSNKRRALLTIEQDTSPGIHDTLIAACDVERYQLLGVEGYHDNCTHNLHMAMGALGLELGFTPAPLNLWMNIPANAGGELNWLPTVSKAGDYMVFSAQQDCVVVISVCPQDMVPINGEDCIPKNLSVELM